MSDFLSDAEFDQFRNFIYNESGIHFSASNRTILESRLKERLKNAGIPTTAEYYALIQNNTEETKVLLDSVTTNLTRFFRNTAHFETLEHHVIPDLIARKKEKSDKKIRIWSAGCSTGEEPYSIAMMLHRILPPGYAAEITASDISLKSLMTGKEGLYAENRMNGVPADYLSTYFEKKGTNYQIKDTVKQTVTFDYHNLKNDSGLRNLDIVFCRNVLIYFDETAQKDSVNRFWDVMAPHSYLFIGHSESLFGMNTRFEFLKTDWACIYQKNVT